MRSYLVAALLAVASISCAGTTPNAALARQPQPEPTGPMSEVDGLRVMRVLLSTQMNAPFGQKQGFGTLSEVLKEAGPQFGPAVPIDTNSAFVSDYTVRVVRSSDKKHFQATLTPVKGCGPAWFGDERSLIFTGKGLGC